MKQDSTLVFIPSNLIYKQTGYLKGCKKCFENSEVYYVTSNKPIRNTYQYQCIGFVGETVDFKDSIGNIPLFINSKNGQLSVENNSSITQILYDYDRFKNSDLIHNQSEKYGQHFKYLSEKLKTTREISQNGRNSITKYILFLVQIFDYILKITRRIHQIVQKSSTFAHFEGNITTAKWFLTTLMEERKITPKVGNTICAKIIDLVIGVILTTYLFEYEQQIFDFINFNTEVIISNLRGLLLYLMGQPIGLKLNYSYNNFLGRFFLYHISLWRIFLQGLYPLFTGYFKFLVLPGFLGFSYQIAMISDVVSIATFHSYCIYIYAARLFNLQLKCLKSLWRVLIGRKFNPLRDRVDSCQYSQDQLFIGTLSFTILFFLLPTTMMYYVVFTVFRLITLTVYKCLHIVRNTMQTIPIYLLFLWIVNASSMAGNIHIAWKSFDDRGNVKIEAKLEKLPLLESVKKFIPESESPAKNPRGFGEIFHSILTGTIL
ncbi:unnamed protein product [Phyllotreta striolata]|uniref:Phosphatidylinositol N-acetylglucosaminyltransferase subunit Q n=1 Tax=Phyllotreta striolata TaxID=444603 RepID=A0A9N9XKA2_PHYSR|nr:unnamed protein product [Phyllotreta striolata]